jgi:xylan 1,4-beta-xylosidase
MRGPHHETAHRSHRRAHQIGDEMRPVWRYFGYDEPNYTYMKDGQKLLSQLRALSPQAVFIRTHNLLTSGDGRPALK